MHFGRNIAVQLRVPCPIYFSHAALAEQACDFIGTDLCADVDDHRTSGRL